MNLFVNPVNPLVNLFVNVVTLLVNLCISLSTSSNLLVDLVNLLVNLSPPSQLNPLANLVNPLVNLLINLSNQVVIVRPTIEYPVVIIDDAEFREAAVDLIENKLASLLTS